MQSENVAASNAGVGAWAFDFYLPASITHAADPDEKHEWLNAGLEAYLASSNKSLMKFWVTVIANSAYGLAYPTSNPYKYLTAFSNYVANLMMDPQYLRIGGKPVIGFFSSGGDVTLSLAQWQSFLSPMGGQSAVYGIEMSGSTANFNTYGLQARFKYGIQNIGSGAGHQAFSYSSTRDQTYWNQALLSGESRISQITPANDGRALDTALSGTRTFVDQPTQPELYAFIQGGFGVYNSQMAITFYDESAEEGAAIHPTDQEGTRYLDAFKWAKKGDLPSSYTYPIDAYSNAITNNGTWTYVDPYQFSNPTLHDHDQVVSANTGDYKELTNHPRLISVDVYAETGPDEGIVEIDKDGVSQGNVDCYATSQTRSNKIATVSFGTPGTHTVRAQVTGTKNASSSSVQIKLDYFNVTYQP